MNEQIETLSNEFFSCAKILTAIGDETRQYLILEMMKMGKCDGVRVGEITQKTHLSRPAVSHHLQILKDAGILKVRKDGTKNYYFFDHDMTAFTKLINTMQLAIDISKKLNNNN